MFFHRGLCGEAQLTLLGKVTTRILIMSNISIRKPRFVVAKVRFRDWESLRIINFINIHFKVLLILTFNEIARRKTYL